MGTVLVTTILSVGLLASGHVQSDGDAVVGTWTGPARCLHANGETFTMAITRDSDGRLRGTMDWARSSSDGRRGPGVPFTTLTVKGATITATLTANGRTARLEATVDGDTIAGGWSTDGDDDRWTFEGQRQVPRAAAATLGSGPGPSSDESRSGDVLRDGPSPWTLSRGAIGHRQEGHVQDDFAEGSFQG